MRRREVLKAATVGMGAVSVGLCPSGCGPRRRSRTTRSTCWSSEAVRRDDCSLQAARAGARTTLVEMGSQLGGVGRRSVPAAGATLCYYEFPCRSRRRPRAGWWRLPARPSGSQGGGIGGFRRRPVGPLGREVER